MPDQLRLQVYLAKCGIASRRKCEEIIAQGRVSVNGKVVIVPGTKVEEDDIVTYDGRKIRQAKQKIYIALHKPSKFLCSTTDPDGRALAIDLITPVIKQRLFYVGRLDYLTSGLIFFTNDGDFSKKMTHPSTHIEKEYVVTTKDEIPLELMEEFKKGIYVQGERFKMKDFEFKGTRCVHIILEEGKNRELRKVFLSRNISVKKVHRIRIGSIELKGIHSGHFKKLNEKEVRSLIKAADAKGADTRAKKKSISHIKTVEKQMDAIQKQKDLVKSESEDSSTSKNKKNTESRDLERNSSAKRSYSDKPTGNRGFSKSSTGKRSYSDKPTGNRDFSKSRTGKRSYSEKPTGDRDFSKSSTGKRSYSEKPTGDRDFSKSSTGKRSYSDKPTGNRDFSKSSTGKRSYSDKPTGSRDFSKSSTGKRSYSDKNTSGKRSHSENPTKNRDNKKSNTSGNNKYFNSRGNK